MEDLGSSHFILVSQGVDLGLIPAKWQDSCQFQLPHAHTVVSFKHSLHTRPQIVNGQKGQRVPLRTKYSFPEAPEQVSSLVSNCSEPV